MFSNAATAIAYLLKQNFILSAILILASFRLTRCFQAELSVLVEPGTRECFHQYFIRDLTIEVDYQVISGGELDISFWISSPSNRIIFNEQRRTTGTPQFKTDEIGEYRFCFDNSFSRFAIKQVHFYIGSHESYVDPLFSKAAVLGDAPKLDEDKLGELEDKLENFRETFHKVVNNLERAQRLQNIFKSYEMIDRSLMEHSFERVNFYSTLNIFIMILVACIQVIMIRSLFEDKSRIGKVLRGAKSNDDNRKTIT